MGFLSEFWSGLVLGQQIFLCIAVPATVLMIILIVSMLLGIGDDDIDAGDSDMDSDGDVADAGLSFFTLRGIVSMLCIMGWSGFVFLDADLGIAPPIGVVIAVGMGLVTLVLVAFAMRGIARLQSSGNLDIRNAIGKVGQVYLTIPAGGKSAGKVNLTIQEQFKEFSAMTVSDEPIKTGEYVRVVSVSDTGVLMVEPINKQ